MVLFEFLNMLSKGSTEPLLVEAQSRYGWGSGPVLDADNCFQGK